MNKLFSNKKNEKGQGLVEYAIILALIAIVVIGVMTSLGKKVNSAIGKVNDGLGGGSFTSEYATWPLARTAYCADKSSGTQYTDYQNTSTGQFIAGPLGSPAPSGYTVYGNISCP